MYDKQTLKLIPEADGNINMMRNTILEWKKHRPDDVFFILLPSEFDNPDSLHNILPDGTLNAAPIFYDNYVVSARINRYNFPMNEFIDILDIEEFDLVINDVIEITPNFRQMFKVHFNYEPKIISNIRHVDEGIKSGYILSVIDGIYKSDLVTILSDSMKKRLRKQMTHASIDFRVADNLMKYIEVFEPSISESEIKKYKNSFLMKNHINMDKKIITFHGRLSKGEENRTNWDKFFEAIFSLRAQRTDFEVYFTDPNNSMSLTYEVDWIHTIEKDREEFFNLLHKTDIIVSLMDVEGFGGISIREALLMGCRPIIPFKDEYKKMTYEAYHGFTHSPVTVADLEYRLNWALDRGIHGKCITSEREYWNLRGLQFTVEEQFKNLLPKIEEML
jgi:hypothetical protein